MLKPDATAPDGSQVRRLVSDASRASLVEIRLAAGQVSRPIRHRTVEEIWFVLEGKGEVWQGGRTDALKPGSRLVIRTGIPFQFRASEGHDLRFLCYTSPPWPGPDEAEPVAEGGLGRPTV